MKRKALSCILALTMCVALLVSGCGNTKSDKNDDGKKSSKKDEIHIAISANPPSLDPQSVNSNIVGELEFMYTNRCLQWMKIMSQHLS